MSVTRDDDAIVVSVRDDGPRAGWLPNPGAGRGLDGLRERVATLGGEVSARPAGQGWHLTARLSDREPG
ncbi:hypothetical protein [Micromonospora qiuiae]|uniref:hypothetical protein n=1 Tax=Micromonospora qiuiae TaxID=502268 RepID=UPI0019507B4B|nr:hypothetical protein [Micromonospora qiuiae]